MTHHNTLCTTTLLVLCFLAFSCLVFPQKIQAVSPAPDGGYPGGNTAEGTSALLSRSTGMYNTAIGVFSLLSLTDGSFCTGVGAGTLLVDTGSQNTATGAGALLSNTTGGNNTANGAFALFSNTIGIQNTANGAGALQKNVADNNTAFGAFALYANTSGSDNTAVGSIALPSNAAGSRNTAIGVNALNNSNGDDNTATGVNAIGANTSGASNTADGYRALEFSASGSNNVALGAHAGSGVTTASNVICIGANVAGNDVADSCYIGNIFGDTSSGGTAVFVNTNGRLGTTTSSRRFKEEIKPMERASEVLLGLKPVTFRYKKEIDPQRIPQFGLVAEDVAAVTPDLVVRDKEGKPYSVRYEQVNAMLLNEFLKEHKKVEEQQAGITELDSRMARQDTTITQQQSEIAALSATVKEQAAQIQRVSAQVEAAKPAPQIARNR